MSFLKNTRRRLFSLTKTDDKLEEESENTHRGSDAGVSDSTTNSRRRFSLFPQRQSSESSDHRRSSGVSQTISIGDAGAEQAEAEKAKPSDYMFLLQDNPKLVWKESESSTNEEDATFNTLIESHEEEKVFFNKERNLTANCKIVSKFSEDHFDDYLYEIGILTERYQKFEHYMSEIEILRQCNHSNFVKFYDAYFYDNKLWIFTEYCPSGSVEELIDDLNKPLNIQQIHYVTKNVLFGLDYLHNQCHMTHLDIKCANLLIGIDYSIKLVHFEMAVRNSLKSELKGDKRYIYVKSPHFCAPEIIKSQNYLMTNYKSDIWSLGITCIEMADMLPPFSEINPEAIIDDVKLSNESSSFKPSLKDPDAWPEEFASFVKDCLIRSYDSRPNAAELLKHDFIRRTQSKQSDIEELINERKTMAYAQLKEKFESLQANIEKMNMIKKQPDDFISEYFEDIRRQIQQKALESKERIDKEQAKLNDMVTSYQETCSKEFSKLSRNQVNSVDKISRKFQNELSVWRENFHQSLVSENAIHRTKSQIKTLKHLTDTKLNDLQTSVFGNKVYRFQPKLNPIKFGELVVENNATHTSLVNNIPVRKQSVVSVTSDNNDDEYENTNKSMRPANRLIRIEIKRPNTKKRYSIY